MSAPDRYEIQAQYTPAILCAAPFVFFGIYYLAHIDLAFWPKLFAIGFGGVTLTAALYQLSAHACQIIGKKLESLIFQDGLNFPTTEFLLDDSTTFSAERKLQIINKARTSFKIDLRARTTDTVENRKRINEVIGQIRKPLWKKNPMILQRNIQYGFARNLAGGSILASLASLVLVIIGLASANHMVLAMSSLFLAIYLVSTITFIFAMKFRAKYYALTLFDEFLGS